MIRFELLSRFVLRSFFRSLYEQQEGRSAGSHTRGGERVYGERRETRWRGRRCATPLKFFFLMKVFAEAFYKKPENPKQRNSKTAAKKPIKLPIPMNRETPYSRTSPPKSNRNAPSSFSGECVPIFILFGSLPRAPMRRKSAPVFHRQSIAVPFVFSVYHTERQFVKGGGKNFKSETKKG